MFDRQAYWKVRVNSDVQVQEGLKQFDYAKSLLSGNMDVPTNIKIEGD